MAEILSQQEIDSLLAGIESGKHEEKTQNVDERFVDKNIHVFDFRLPHRLSKNQLRTLQAVHESFAESLSSVLVSRLQTTVSVNVTTVDQIFYSEYVLSISSPSALYIFRIHESDAFAILELSPELVLAMVARLLGGPPDNDCKARHITRIEQSIVRGLVDRTLENLQKAWKVISPLTFSYERFESEGEFAQVAPASEIVLVVSFEVGIGDKKHLMNICFPTFALDDILSKLNSHHFTGMGPGLKGENRGTEILQSIEDTKIPVVGVLGTTTLTLRELISLEPGDIIQTNINLNSDVELLFQGKKKVWGKPGIHNNRTALKVTRIINSDSK